jgi:release factor glutamine methyltransferase
MKYLRKQVPYDDFTFHIFRNVYEPAEDTFLAADHLIVNEDDIVLDMGTGCGIIAILAAQKAKKVVAVDINPHAVRCAKKNAEINKLVGKIDIRNGDLFKPIRKSEKFSLIVFNAPYLPSAIEEGGSWLGKSWAGGSTGRQSIDRFIAEVPKHLKKDGRVLLVQSSLSNIDETFGRFRKAELKAQVIAEKKVSFETIVLIQASHLSR